MNLQDEVRGLYQKAGDTPVYGLYFCTSEDSSPQHEQSYALFSEIAALTRDHFYFDPFLVLGHPTKAGPISLTVLSRETLNEVDAVEICKLISTVVTGEVRMSLKILLHNKPDARSFRDDDDSPDGFDNDDDDSPPKPKPSSPLTLQRAHKRSPSATSA